MPQGRFSPGVQLKAMSVCIGAPPSGVVVAGHWPWAFGAGAVQPW